MALNIVDTLTGNRVSSNANVFSYLEEGKEEAFRIVISKSSYTQEDGSVLTTTRYSDGTTETEVTDGDNVVLSAAAQNLFTNQY
jgi:hypothetical protein